MRELFADYDVEAVSKLISPDPIKRHIPGQHYSCYVDLASKEDASHAIHILNGRPASFGGHYKLDHAVSKRPATKVEREQLGVGSRIFVGGLPDDESQEQIDDRVREIFAGWEVVKIGPTIKPFHAKDTKHQNHNYCYIDLADSSAAQCAVDSVNKRTDRHGRLHKVRVAHCTDAKTLLYKDQHLWKQVKAPDAIRDLTRNWRQSA